MINDKRRAAWAVAIFTTLSVALGGCCINPAGSAFSEAEELAALGNHDGAIAAYGEVQAKWPDSEEALQVPDAITDVMIARAGEQYEAGEWEKSGRSFLEVVARVGDAVDTIERVEEATGTDAAMAAIYVEKIDRGTTDDGLDGMVDFLRKYSHRIPPGLKEEASGWLCSHRAEFPAYVTCRDLEADVESMSPAEAVALKDEAGEACGRVLGMVNKCEGDVGEEVLAIVQSDTLKQLNTNVEAKLAQWEKASEREASPIRSQVGSIQRECERWQRQIDGMQEDLLIYALEDRWGPLVRLSTKRDALDAKKTGNDEKLDELAEDVVTKDWPESVVESVNEAIKAAEAECD